VTELAATVATLEAEALAQLEATLGGVAMCRVGEAAARPAKHWEGRAAALAQVRRALRRAEPGGEADVLRRAHAEWTAQLEALGGPAWTTYTAAGLQALEELTR
jgi:hypothetical protein